MAISAVKNRNHKGLRSHTVPRSDFVGENMASVTARMIRGVQRSRRELADADSLPPATAAALPAGNSGRKMEDPVEMRTEASVSSVNYNVASPRAFLRSAPIEGRDDTAMIGAAANYPRVPGTFAIPDDTRITIAVRSSSCPPEPSTGGGAAKEGRNAPVAIDTEVVLARIHMVDDPRDSGARKLRPGVFIGPRGHGPCDLASQKAFGN